MCACACVCTGTNCLKWRGVTESGDASIGDDADNGGHGDFCDSGNFGDSDGNKSSVIANMAYDDESSPSFSSAILPLPLLRLPLWFSLPFPPAMRSVDKFTSRSQVSLPCCR